MQNLLGEILTILCFPHAEAEVKKNDITGMITAANEACIG